MNASRRSDRQVFSTVSLAAEFAKIAGFRNFLAHDCESADAKRICRFALERLLDIEEYIRQIRGGLGLT